MYGLVNKAVEGLVRDRFGDDAWERIKEKAGIEDDTFISMEPYPDDLTYSLVAAASEVLDTPAEDILKAFGEYWVLYIAKEGYGELLNMAGSTLKEFLHHLDDLHVHVGLSFADLKPPSFRCSDEGEDSLLLHYYSDRSGLAPMVIGLLNGLGSMFETEIDVTQTQSRDDNFDHDVFLVKFAST